LARTSDCSFWWPARSRSGSFPVPDHASQGVRHIASQLAAGHFAAGSLLRGLASRSPRREPFVDGFRAHGGGTAPGQF